MKNLNLLLFIVLCSNTTTIPSQHKLYTLMYNPQYRLSIAWQNVGYNQPRHTDFYLGKGMKNNQNQISSP